MYSDLELEEIALGERKLNKKYSPEKKADYEEKIAEINKSNEEILKKFPSMQMEQAVFKKMMADSNSDFKTENKGSSKKTFKYNRIKYLSIAVAAVFAICIIPTSLRLSNNYNGQNTVRTKGKVSKDPQMKLYRNAGKYVELVKNGDKAYENDQIQITYKSGKQKYGLIFSVDGNGNITKHLYSGNFGSVILENSTEEIPLEYSYVLDDAPDYECFVFVTSNKPFKLDNDKILKKSMKNIKYVTKGKYLPKYCEKTVFILNK